MYNINQIINVHLELSSNCNANCPRCQRNFHGYEFNRGYSVTELSLADIKTIFPPEFVKQIDCIDFNGNFGDFLLAKENLEIIEYFRNLNPKHLTLNIHTNGSARNEIFWTKLASFQPRVLFDLDGLEDTHSKYRIGTNFNTIIRNATAFIKAGGNATWKMIPFEYNKHQIEECKQLSRELGFKEFVLFDQGRDSGPVYDKKGQFLYDLKPDATQKFKDVFEHMDQWTKDSLANNFWGAKKEIACKAQEKKSIYVTAEGEVYPCCFLGFSPRTFKGQIGNDQIRSMIDGVNNNAKLKPIAECISWFYKVSDSWKIEEYKDGRMFICNRVCGKDTNNKLMKPHVKYRH